MASNPSSESDIVRLGVLGFGNVGAAFVQLVVQQADTIEARTGIRLEVARVAVRDLSSAREKQLAKGVMSTDARALVADPGIDLIVEVMGGIDPAGELITLALANGKPVVTANKALLSQSGTDLFAVSDSCGVDLLFEAAVAGGIPFVRALRESLRGEPIRRVMGIVNGTTNYILTKMTEDAAQYPEALAEAQQLGFAESDPTADVEGHDAAAKAAIIASIAFGAHVVVSDVYCEGISNITSADISIAHRLGYVIKLLAIAEQASDSPDIAVRVHPAMVPVTHPLASVRDSYNAIFIEGEAVGSLMFYGRGAGGMPTASAVLGDVIDAAVNLRKGTHADIGTFAQVPIKAIADISSQYLLGFDVADKPGVLHAITGVFARHGVSIRQAEQEGIGDDARLVFVTHAARESDVQKCLQEFRELDVVKKSLGLIRVIGE
ncbi:MAG: homoserine dehydrogenase [Ilumatobacteraceae bacterium]|nr:homoserine dehydrogenase [Ilumatobacteraceae bacterium]